MAAWPLTALISALPSSLAQAKAARGGAAKTLPRPHRAMPLVGATLLDLVNAIMLCARAGAACGRVVGSIASAASSESWLPQPSSPPSHSPSVRPSTPPRRLGALCSPQCSGAPAEPLRAAPSSAPPLWWPATSGPPLPPHGRASLARPNRQWSGGSSTGGELGGSNRWSNQPHRAPASTIASTTSSPRQAIAATASPARSTCSTALAAPRARPSRRTSLSPAPSPR